MIAPEAVDLVVLAGGRGSRLGGVVKPLVRRRDGRTLLEHVLATLLLGRRAWVVAPRSLFPPLEPALGAIARAYEAPGAGPPRELRLVEDPGEGPALAVLEAARASDADWLFVVAGDHVSPSRGLAARLFAIASEHQGAWVVGVDGRPEPLYAVLDRVALLERAGDAPPRSAARLFGRLLMASVALERLPVEEAAGLADVDTPEDLDAHGLELPGPLSVETPSGEAPRRSSPRRG